MRVWRAKDRRGSGEVERHARATLGHGTRRLGMAPGAWAWHPGQ